MRHNPSPSSGKVAQKLTMSLAPRPGSPRPMVSAVMHTRVRGESVAADAAGVAAGEGAGRGGSQGGQDIQPVGLGHGHGVTFPGQVAGDVFPGGLVVHGDGQLVGTTGFEAFLGAQHRHGAGQPSAI